MLMKSFSEESIKRAEAAIVLGFNCVMRYTRHTGTTPSASIQGIRLVDKSRSCELNPSWFPELDDNETMDLAYIVHHALIMSVI